MVLLALVGCGPRCDVDLPPIDYGADASWICRPGADDACSGPITAFEVEDGVASPSDSLPAADPPVDCFYVYPTMDLHLRGGLHDDLADTDGAIRATRLQAARLHEVCRVFVPVYRQVTLGTYARPKAGAACFDHAFDDVSAAFDAFLAQIGDRPYVVLGHSQGGQLVSRLVRERIEPDDGLRGRMIVAMAIGWPVATSEGATVGGSFSTVPICTAADQTGCALAYRSFFAGHSPPTMQGPYVEGDEVACTNPASPADPEARAALAGAWFAADGSMADRPRGVDRSDTNFLIWRDDFTARCRPGGLEVDWEGDGPNPLKAGVLGGAAGTHVMDISFASEDLVDTVRIRGAAWAMR
jgi:pimeloyl-ACP methyl ester carboxylesterase